jgi:uncharacterized protein
VEWFARAAQQNDPRAQTRLGVAYLRGDGTPRDTAKARAWFERGAKAGFAPAEYSLAAMYARGLGVPADNVEAARLYRRAAAKGHNGAQAELGLMYATGRIGPPDYLRAYVWMAVAQTVGDVGFGAIRDKVAAVLTPADLERAKAQVASCLKSKFQDCGEPSSSSTEP